MLPDVTPIPGYEAYYGITQDGQVWSYRRGQFLTPKTDKNGYKEVCLSRDSRTKYYRIHRLVAMTFLPNPEGKGYVNHRNENKGDNRVCNLEWVTAKENSNYGTRNARMADANCKKPVERISPDGTIERFKGVKDASRKTGIAHSQIRKACLNLTNRPWAKEWRYAV